MISSFESDRCSNRYIFFLFRRGNPLRGMPAKIVELHAASLRDVERATLRQSSHRIVDGDELSTTAWSCTASHVTQQEVRRSDLVRIRAADGRTCTVAIFPSVRSQLGGNAATWPAKLRREITSREKDAEGWTEGTGTGAQGINRRDRFRGLFIFAH